MFSFLIFKLITLVSSDVYLQTFFSFLGVFDSFSSSSTAVLHSHVSFLCF